MKTKRKRFRAEREFGLIVGGIFVLLSSWWIYRGKFHSIRDVTIVIGALLVILGVLLPSALVLVGSYFHAVKRSLVGQFCLLASCLLVLGIFFLLFVRTGVFYRLHFYFWIHFLMVIVAVLTSVISVFVQRQR